MTPNPSIERPVAGKPAPAAHGDAIVHAALRAYVEAVFGNFPLKRLSFAASDGAIWVGDLQRGALYNDDGCGSYEVVAWTRAGIVGLAFELVMAAGMLDVGPEHGQLDAGVGFWLYGERIAGTMFNDRRARGASRLAAWSLLHHGRLLPLASSASGHPRPGGIVVDYARPEDAPLHAIIDAVTDRALTGPTEFTTDELATLLPKPPDPETLGYAQRMLQQVGITWPGSPEIPPEESRPTGANPSLPIP